MTALRLGIFGRRDDATVVHTVEVARARGHDALVLPLAELVSALPVALEGDSREIDGDDLAGCDAFVVRSLPAPTALLAPPDVTDTAAGWYRRGAVHGARASFAHSVVVDCELRGAPIINPLAASEPYDHKVVQLAALRRAGVPVPRTLVTNDPTRARAWLAQVPDAIAKPCAGGALARAVDDALLGALDQLREAPAILQERIRGDDVRVTIVGERVLSCVHIDVAEPDAVDYRGADAWVRGDVRYRPLPLPVDVEQACLTAARTCHQVLSGVDLKRTSDGRFVLLECNSVPVYLEVERSTGAPITAAIVEWLERAHAAR